MTCYRKFIVGTRKREKVKIYSKTHRARSEITVAKRGNDLVPKGT